MPVTITNKAKQLLIVPFNSGASISLAPGESSDPVEDFEIENNEKVGKLGRSGLIETKSTEGPTTVSARPARKKARS